MARMCDLYRQSDRLLLVDEVKELSVFSNTKMAITMPKRGLGSFRLGLAVGAAGYY